MINQLASGFDPRFNNRLRVFSQSPELASSSLEKPDKVSHDVVEPPIMIKDRQALIKYLGLNIDFEFNTSDTAKKSLGFIDRLDQLLEGEEFPVNLQDIKSELLTAAEDLKLDEVKNKLTDRKD